MTFLVMEASSSQPSVGVWKDGEQLAHSSWALVRRKPAPLFDHVTQVLQEAGTSLADIETVVVGRGPGNYSGLRIALCAAQGLCLPSNKPVRTVSSAEAMAWGALCQGSHETVGVMGDARRGCVWAGAYRLDNNQAPVELMKWQLIPYEEAASRLPEVAGYWESPDADRLEAVTSSFPEGVWGGGAIPTIEQVAGLAALRLEEGVPSEPASPIYLHPAVVS